MTQFQTDIETLRHVGPIVSDEGSIYATPCLRLDLSFPGPVAMRPKGIDGLLVRAAELMGVHLTVYAASNTFGGGSKGRKPRPDDLNQLALFSAHMHAAQEQNRQQLQQRIDSLKAQGIEPGYDAGTAANDAGTLLLSDARGVSDSAHHINLQGFGVWGMSFSFGLDMAAERPADILSWMTDMLTSGIAASANAGFAFNTAQGLPASLHETYFLPPTRRFRLLNMGQPGKCRPKTGEAGVVPLNSWYWLDHVTARDHGIKDDALSALDGHVHAVTRTEHGTLIKLYEAPVLGDLNEGVDLAPARALGTVLEPALKARGSSRGVPLGEQADIAAWVRRFGPEFGA